MVGFRHERRVDGYKVGGSEQLGQIRDNLNTIWQATRVCQIRVVGQDVHL